MGQAATRTREEVASAIRAFSAADWARLKKVARLYSRLRPIEPDDLLQEGLASAIGSRICPAHVDVVKFVAEAMRSIAHGTAAKAIHRLAVVPKDGPGGQEAFEVPDPTPSVEDRMITNQTYEAHYEQLLALFVDDPIARDIVIGDMSEMTAQEIRDLTGLSKTAYDSKRKLIRRRIEARLQQESGQ